MVREGGPCMARLGNGDNAPLCCHEGLSSTWYGKSGHQFCGSHRAAWNRWKKEHGVEQEEEEPRYLTEMDELLGTRYCEPAEMKPDERFNDVTKSSLQFCVQGTFTAESYTRGMVDTRWQTLEQLSESCSREVAVEMVNTKNARTRGFLRLTPRLYITEHSPERTDPRL
jgi:hypothetical protein